MNTVVGIYRLLQSTFVLFVLASCLISSPLYAGEKAILILDSQSGEPYDTARIAMLDELSKRGFNEGDNLKITRYDVQNKEGLAKRWLRVEGPKKYDVIFVNGTIATLAAMKWGYGSEQKFVFVSVTDPVAIGVISELGKPPFDNFTGVPYGVPPIERLRFLRKVLPQAKTIGLIYTDMPQSVNYIHRIKILLRQPEFHGLNVVSHMIPFINTDKGHIRMAQVTSRVAKQMAPQVDVFITPSDQFGIRQEYAAAIRSATSKPLMGLSRNEVEKWGAHFALYPQQKLAGQKAGKMIAQLFKGAPFRQQIPDYALGERAINLSSSEQIAMQVPSALLQDDEMTFFQTD